MNFGFNSNVDVRGTRYHVQSEDHGPAHPFFDTVVYLAGRVVHKRRTSYAPPSNAAAADDVGAEQKLHESLARQHREVIAQLEAGALDLRPSVFPQELEVELLNPVSWLDHGQAHLEVRVKSSDAAYVHRETVVIAFLELDDQRARHSEATVDESGRATLAFAVPKMSDGATLVIQAHGPEAHGELRFRLHARRKSPPAPAT